MSPPGTVRALFTGNSGSGKTTRAYDLYLRHYPRQIILDATGEWTERCDHVSFDLADLKRAVVSYSRSGRWVIVGQLDDAEIPALIEWLIPTPNVDKSPILAVGGAVLFLDEVDLLAPAGVAPRHIRTLYRRSRHVGLSVVSCTQRPANVSREVSAQSTYLCAHFLSEPRDRDYMVDVMRWSKEEAATWLRWCRQHPHGAALKNVQTGETHLLPDQGKPIPMRTATPQMSLLGDADADERAAG